MNASIDIPGAIARQASLCDTPATAVIGTDLDGRIHFWSSGAERLYGWSGDEAQGRNVVEITPSSVSAEVAHRIMIELREGRSWGGEFPVRRKSGEDFNAVVIDSPVRIRNGKLVGVIGSSFDPADSVSPADEFDPWLRGTLRDLAGCVDRRLDLNVELPDKTAASREFPLREIREILRLALVRIDAVVDPSIKLRASVAPASTTPMVGLRNVRRKDTLHLTIAALLASDGGRPRHRSAAGPEEDRALSFLLNRVGGGSSVLSIPGREISIHLLLPLR